MQKTVRTIKLHESQQDCMSKARRFNAFNCGRRWGKNELAKDLLIEPSLIDRMPVAWFEPTYKSLSEVWKEVKEMFREVISRKDEQLKQLQLYGGGVIDFWSCDNPDSGRGRKYKRVIVNETAMIRNALDVWRKTIRPTLTDYEGDGWLFSTPKGKSNDWYKICQQAEKKKDWVSFKLPTSSNPHISPNEIESARQDLPIVVFQQEYLAEFVDYAEQPFFPKFREHLHVSKDVQVNYNEPLWLSFDFNINPTTCVVGQKIPFDGCYIIDTHQQQGGTAELVQKHLLPYADHPGGLKVTGDYSGNTGSSSAGVLEGGAYHTDYEIIKRELWLNDFDLIDTRTANKTHEYSRRLCNHFFAKVPLKIAAQNERLIYELQTAQQTDKGKLLKDRQNYPMDVTDAFRYLVNAWFQGDFSIINNFARACYESEF